MSAVLVYVTTVDVAEARRIGHALVASRLVACANILERMISIYHWEGAVQEDNEAVLILKTRAALVDAVTEKIVSLHGYDCPCVAALPIEGGNLAFLDWIAAETGEAAS